MANPLPPGIPATFWDGYKKRIEADLAGVRRDLAPLEAGEMHLGSRTGDGPWRDVTGEWIAHHKRTIETFEAILAALAKKEIP
jgi:hypothetical protein